ncbi:MAG: hypothetical protein NTX50_01675 [Candidatus Sumerlaeota bacterium]|nr:hypothetical protein [Candidatus Sumerlaeota bacterium]
MANFGECEKTRSDPRIVLREKRSEICFLNPLRKAIREVRIDGCVIRDGLRCDYLLIVGCTEHYVELKGCDVDHAVKQIETTIRKVSADAKRLEKHSYIVSSRCPALSPQIQGWKIKFRKEFNSSLQLKNRCMEQNL